MLGVEESFGRETALELLEPPAQPAFAGLLEVLDHDLEFATRLVEADPSARDDLGAILDRELHQLIAAAEHAAAHLRRVVLEREIPVSRGRSREVRHLALAPEAAKA